MPFISADGAELFYREAGEGSPLVWVVGTGMNGDAWHRYQVPDFSAAISKFLLET